MQLIYRKFILFLALVSASFIVADAQNLRRELNVKEGATIEIVNRFGRVEVMAETLKSDVETEESELSKVESKASLSAVSETSLAETDIKIDISGNRIRVEISPTDTIKRIDVSLRLPVRMRLKIETGAGEAKVSGDFESVEIRTETGTIAADVPLENVKYDFVWTESRPRFLSDVELEKVEEKAAGKFAVNGKIVNGENPNSKNEKQKSKSANEQPESVEIVSQKSEEPENEPAEEKTKNKKKKIKNRKPKALSLNFTTARGIVLLNIPPNEVLSDLRERPLTEAAKAVVRSGDSLLTEAIRRVSPKYFGDYAKTLPPLKREPSFNERKNARNAPASGLKRVLVNVTDINNRAIADLKKEDFEITESGEPREVLYVQPASASFNLVLLLDVSGSVDNYVNFIRKAARNFVNTVEPKDKIAVIIFNEDIEVVSNFSTDKAKISQSLDTFDAGGATAFYDALAYTLTETLRPLRGERAAIVALTDGDDNRSFLPFDSLLGSLQESGALVYPLYVPSALIAAGTNDPNAGVDPLRARYNGLTTKAEGEGERLARISGGIYYPITRLDQIQKAYDDIVVQLRTAYSVTFRSDLPETSDKTTASPRLKVRVKRENSFVKLGSVVSIDKAAN